MSSPSCAATAANPPNRLGDAASLYLRQHADNPVAWQPWDDQALDLARREDRPILLSIGYASCHWCHVMERESFRCATTARAINAHFVAIKVDREERPDLDTIYMLATQALTGGAAGWPMTVFLTPTLAPFFAGTYFPPAARHGLPAFGEVLAAIDRAWRERRGDCQAQADGLVAALGKMTRPPSSAAAPREGEAAATIDEVVGALAARFDEVEGGFGTAPKFPPHAALALWADLAEDARGAHADLARRLLGTTLRRMARGGMHDLVGGGFARYSVDDRWFVPHFEKMLADNAPLARTYSVAAEILGSAALGKVGASTLDFLRRDLATPQGLFAASLDADDPGGEGAFYSWTPGEVAEAVGAADADRVAAGLGITAAGTWEGGRSLPRLADPEGADALAEACQAMRRARAARPQPTRDEKAVVGDNGLALSALAAAARLAGKGAAVAEGAAVADRLWALAWRGDHLLRCAAAPREGGPRAVLADVVNLAAGLIDLFEAGAPQVHLERAVHLGEWLVDAFRGPADGLLYDTPDGQPDLLFRPREGQDGPLPSPQAGAARLLGRLAAHAGRPFWRLVAEQILASWGAEARRAPAAFAGWARAQHLLSRPEVAWTVVRPTACRAAWDDPLTRATLARADLGDLVAHARCGDPALAADSGWPLLAGRRAEGGRATLWRCADGACAAPAFALAQGRGRPVAAAPRGRGDG